MISAVRESENLDIACPRMLAYSGPLFSALKLENLDGVVPQDPLLVIVPYL